MPVKDRSHPVEVSMKPPMGSSPQLAQPQLEPRAIQTTAHATPPFGMPPTELTTNDHKREASIWHFLSA